MKFLVMNENTYMSVKDAAHGNEPTEYARFKRYCDLLVTFVAGDLCGRRGRRCRRREKGVLPPDHERAAWSQIRNVSLLRGVSPHLVFKQGTCFKPGGISAWSLWNPSSIKCWQSPTVPCRHLRTLTCSTSSGSSAVWPSTISPSLSSTSPWPFTRSFWRRSQR